VTALLAHAHAKLEAARVLLAYSSHAQVLGAFNRDFVHSGTFPREFSAILARLFEDRQTGDYDPTASLDLAEAERDVEDAQRIVDEVAEHLSR
jgi:uncharacterized protein (UPF0332 family)